MTHFDIEETSISKSGTSISTQHDIEETSISKFKTLISLYSDIEDFSISINDPSISVYDIEALYFDIELRVLRYRCFFVGSSLGCYSSYSVLDTDCGVHIALRINHHPWLMRRQGRPQSPQRRLHSAGLQHLQQCRSTGRSTGRSRRSALRPAEYVKLNLVPESPWPSRRSARFPLLRFVNHNHGLNNESSQSSHGGGVLVMPNTRNRQRNAGAWDLILRDNDRLAPSLG